VRAERRAARASTRPLLRLAALAPAHEHAAASNAWRDRISDWALLCPQVSGRSLPWRACSTAEPRVWRRLAAEARSARARRATHALRAAQEPAGAGRGQVRARGRTGPEPGARAGGRAAGVQRCAACVGRVGARSAARAHGAAGAAGGRRKTCAAGSGAAAAPDLMLCVRCAVQEPPRCGLGERRRVLQAGWLVRRRRPRPSTRPAREQRGGRRAGAGERTGGAPSRA